MLICWFTKPDGAQRELNEAQCGLIYILESSASLHSLHCSVVSNNTESITQVHIRQGLLIKSRSILDAPLPWGSFDWSTFRRWSNGQISGQCDASTLGAIDCNTNTCKSLEARAECGEMLHCMTDVVFGTVKKNWDAPGTNKTLSCFST